MKKLLFVLIFIPQLCISQQLKIEELNFSINTSFKGNELAYIDSLFNHVELNIELVQLLPICENNDCYEGSIVLATPNKQRSDLDSIFAAEYFIGVESSRIDTTNSVKVNKEDFPFILNQLLIGPQKLANNELINNCYNPRHAVLFKDQNNTIIAIQEICFECGHTKVAIYTSQINYNTSFAYFELFKRSGLIK